VSSLDFQLYQVAISSNSVVPVEISEVEGLALTCIQQEGVHLPVGMMSKDDYWEARHFITFRCL
jgi:hypothetical protein